MSMFTSRVRTSNGMKTINSKQNPSTGLNSVSSHVEDFNNEIVLGDTREESLYDIWNGEKYTAFRSNHFDLTPGIKCTEQCDMQLIGSFLSD